MLPCLITDICKTFISDQEYSDGLDNHSSVIAVEQLTRGYGLCAQYNWTEAVQIDHVRHQRAEQMSEEDFWQQNNPTGLEDYIDYSCEAFRRMNMKLDKVLEGEASGAQEKRCRKRR